MSALQGSGEPSREVGTRRPAQSGLTYEVWSGSGVFAAASPVSIY